MLSAQFLIMTDVLLHHDRAGHEAHSPGPVVGATAHCLCLSESCVRPDRPGGVQRYRRVCRNPPDCPDGHSHSLWMT